ncbi:hypothetical protein ACFWIY_02400 [Streptomyces sioyaensis]|uniref:hypothetical protein n=1 Tax=Streptomyces sioyaensis TaxID=67364 RepID=UPI0036472685
MIESLRAFTVSVEYARAHTTFLVRADGQREPVARVHREVHYEGLRPYTVTAGPGLTECVGHLDEWKGWLPDRTLVGTVERSRRTNSADRWTFAQPTGRASSCPGSRPRRPKGPGKVPKGPRARALGPAPQPGPVAPLVRPIGRGPGRLGGLY